MQLERAIMWFWNLENIICFDKNPEIRWEENINCDTIGIDWVYLVHHSGK